MKNLFTKLLSAAMVLAVSLTMVAMPALAEENVPADAVNSVTAADDSSVDEYTFDYSIKTYKKTYKKSNGTVYMVAKYQYPVFKGSNTEAVEKLNAVYAAELKAFKEDVAKKLPEAKKMAKKNNCYSETVTCKKSNTYLGARMYVSVVQNGESYLMGAHGNPYKVTHVFNVNTGEEVSAAELTGLSDKAAVNTAVRSAYVAKYKKNPKQFLAGSVKAFKKDVNKVDFSKKYYINSKGKVTFYADVYEIAPYATGYVYVNKKLVYPTAKFTCEDGDNCTLTMEQVAADTYMVNIGITRLAAFEGVAVEENGVLKFKDEAANVAGEIVIDGNKATFTITDSNKSETFVEGDSFSFVK